MILAATGPRYAAMAQTVANGVRKHSPGLPIHAFLDRDALAPDVDQVIRLENPWRRSKIDAMIAAPFDRNLFLDADVFVVSDLSDVFGLLDRFDIALAHDQERNSHHGRATWRTAFPASFPQFNSGVVLYRRSEPVLALLRAWHDAVRDDSLKRDQGALRELLWRSDLRIATLPPEYNLMDMSPVMRLSSATPAPRIIHNYAAHRNRQGGIATCVEDAFGPAVARAIEFMRRRDHTLFEDAGRLRRGRRQRLVKRLLQIWILTDLFVRRAVNAARRKA